MLKKQKGFTFIEVLIFTAIISFLFISMTSTVISSLQRMQVTEHRLYANRHAEELVEWLRSEKEADWEAFVARDTGNGSGTPYCFNDQLNFLDPAPVWPAVTLENCTYTGVGTPPLIYKRYAQLTAENLNQVNIEIVVEWREGNKYYSVPINTVFTNIDENVPTPTP
jgi:Tfp pilus assembly protein PilV